MVALRRGPGDEEDDAEAPLSRWVPDVPLPRYAYVPGFNAHPLRDPDGHRCIHAHALVEEAAGLWWQDRAYLYGFDLVHHRFLWESHEVWEARWKARSTDDPRRWLLQALIQMAAARLKEHMDDAHTASRLRRASLARLERVETALGVDVDGLHLPQVRSQIAPGLWPRLLLTMPSEPS